MSLVHALRALRHDADASRHLPRFPVKEDRHAAEGARRHNGNPPS